MQIVKIVTVTLAALGATASFAQNYDNLSNAANGFLGSRSNFEGSFEVPVIFESVPAEFKHLAGISIENGYVVQDIIRPASEVQADLNYKLNGALASDFVDAYLASQGPEKHHDIWMKHNLWQVEPILVALGKDPSKMNVDSTIELFRSLNPERINEFSGAQQEKIAQFRSFGDLTELEQAKDIRTYELTRELSTTFTDVMELKRAVARGLHDTIWLPDYKANPANYQNDPVEKEADGSPKKVLKPRNKPIPLPSIPAEFTGRSDVSLVKGTLVQNLRGSKMVPALVARLGAENAARFSQLAQRLVAQGLIVDRRILLEVFNDHSSSPQNDEAQVAADDRLVKAIEAMVKAQYNTVEKMVTETVNTVDTLEKGLVYREVAILDTLRSVRETLREAILIERTAKIAKAIEPRIK